MEVDFSGNFTNIENVEDGEIVEITEEGNAEEKEGQYGKYVQVTIPIKTSSGKELMHSLRNAEGKDLVLAFGKDTKNWIGKQAKALHVVQFVKGEKKKHVELEPIKVEKV